MLIIRVFMPNSAPGFELEPVLTLFQDVGCGGGILSERLARLGADVIGIDPVETNIFCAREHAKKDPSLADRLNYRFVQPQRQRIRMKRSRDRSPLF